MRARRAGERGQVAVYAVVLFPLLLLVLSLVYVVGSVEDLRSRIRADLDMAALTATQALDPTALAAGAPPRLLPDEADQLARQYLAQNLDGLGSLLAESPSDAAASADVVVTNSGTDPITGCGRDRADRDDPAGRAGPHRHAQRRRPSVHDFPDPRRVSRREDVTDE